MPTSHDEDVGQRIRTRLENLVIELEAKRDASATKLKGFQFMYAQAEAAEDATTFAECQRRMKQKTRDLAEANRLVANAQERLDGIKRIASAQMDTGYDSVMGEAAGYYRQHRDLLAENYDSRAELHTGVNADALELHGLQRTHEYEDALSARLEDDQERAYSDEDAHLVDGENPWVLHKQRKREKEERQTLAAKERRAEQRKLQQQEEDDARKLSVVLSEFPNIHASPDSDKEEEDARQARRHSAAAKNNIRHGQLNEKARKENKLKRDKAMSAFM